MLTVKVKFVVPASVSTAVTSLIWSSAGWFTTRSAEVAALAPMPVSKAPAGI